MFLVEFIPKTFSYLISDNSIYKVPLDVWVKDQTKGEYERLPAVAISDVSAALRYAYRVGIAQNRPEIFEEALKFAKHVTHEFKTNDFNNYTTKFGTGRVKDIIGSLEVSVQVTFEQLMTDPTIPMEERAAIWAGVDNLESGIRPRVYDRITPLLRAQFQKHPLSTIKSFDKVFPEPPGLQAWRQKMAIEAKRAQERENKKSSSTSIKRK